MPKSPTLEQYEQLADLIGEAVSAGNESYTARELGFKAIHAIEKAGWCWMTKEIREIPS